MGMHRSNRQEMKLIGFSFFLLLVHTFRGIEGDVQCGDSNTVPHCMYCIFASPPATPGIDMQNCITSLHCMLNDDSSVCVRRPAVPAVQCPEVCYYQVCKTFAADLSRIGDGEDGLGTGGYCAPTAEPNYQYIYCCDLRSYFTHPNITAAGDFRPKKPEDIKFPECSRMINDLPTP